MLNSKSDPATLGSDRYPPLAGRNPKQTRNPNYQNSKQVFSFRKRFCFENLDFEHLLAPAVTRVQVILFRISDFVLRISG